MNNPAPVGVVKAVWRFPVKSMGGESLASADVTERGCHGDRAYALIDPASGKVINGKHALGPAMVRCQAAFVAPPVTADEAPPVEITLPDGTSVRSDAAGAEATLARFFGHSVKLVRSSPLDPAIDRYRVDTERVRSPFLQEAGLPVAAPMPAFFDLLPMTVVTTGTLQRLEELRPESRFDERRFRMNVVVDTPVVGFVENGWLRGELQFGEHVRLRVELPAVRCSVTTLAQSDLPKDGDVLKTAARHNSIRVAGKAYPCVGVFASVRSGGTISTHDAVRVIEPAIGC